MAISVSGLGSGLDYDSWIEELVAIKQADIDEVSAKVKAKGEAQDTLSDLETDYKSLQSAIEKFTAALSTEDVFNQKIATSSSEAVTAAVTSGAEAQDITVGVSQLATATTAESSYSVASYADAATSLSDISNGTIKSGSFTIYVDGEKQEITVGSGETDDTLGEIVETINGLTGVNASLSSDGKLTIGAEDGHTVTVGSTSDTSNFTNVMSLTRDTETGIYSSSKSIFDTSTSANITDTTFRNAAGEDVTVRTGTFSIADVEITIAADDSINDIINKINKSGAEVTAAWDSNTGKLTLAAEDEGAVAISIEAGSSNFTDAMGLTTSTWSTSEESGETVYTCTSTKINMDAQDLGTNAVLTINGTTITSSSNTVTSDISGIKGLTLTLNSETSSDSTVKVEQDTTEITEAITNLVDSYNKVISDTDAATTTDGDLYGETILNSLRTKLRRLASADIDGEDGYKTLASIGITTGSVSTDTSAKTNQLIIDTDKLTAALLDNADAVKTLLVGDSDTSGVLDNMEKIVDDALNVTNGYFTTRTQSYEKQIGRLNDKVDKMTTELEKYQEQLEAKFAAMDELISALKNQASVFDSYFSSDNNQRQIAK